MFRYAMKRVSHSTKLFAALLIATSLGTAFFAGAIIASDVVTRGAGNQALSQVVVDFFVSPPNPYPSVTHSSDLIPLNRSVSRVERINATEIISYCYPQVTGKLNRSQFIVVGVQNDSLVMRGIKGANSDKPLGANETYVSTASPDLIALSPKGSIVTLNFTSYVQFGNAASASWNLTVKGVVSLSDRSLHIAKNDLYYYAPYYQYNVYNYIYKPNILIISWNKTCSKMMDYLGGKSSNLANSFSSGVIASVDHEKLVSSYDVAGTVQELEKISAQLSNTVSSSTVTSQFGFYPNVNAPILNAMSYYMSQLMLLQIAMIGVAIPVFFVAWYVGGTASGVSYNLRRREIGLLLARGFTKRNIMKLFLTEAILIGLVSGLVGFFVGVLIIPLVFGSAIPSGIQGLEYILTTAGIQTIITTIVIGVFLSVFTVYRAANRASSMTTIDALKEYTYVEQTKKSPISKLTWLAFILGTYKMIAWIIGLNLYTIMFSLYSNLVLFMLVSIFAFIDSFLTLLGPILFIYGAVKLVTQGSARLQRRVGSIGRSAFGESGLLASKNIQRNPARNFAVAFIIALIVGYGVAVVGGSAASYDYQYRSIYNNVGADVSTHLTTGSNITLVSAQVANITGVSGVTLQSNVYSYSSQGSLTLKAVDPLKWQQVAYYEDGWFRGASVQKAFQSMSKDNFTIILDSGVADYLSLGINDTIAITFSTPSGQYSHTFRVVGFFGPKPVQTYGIYGSYYYSTYRSYIPVAAINNMNVTSVDDQLLIKLNPDANATSVVQEINTSVQNATNTQSASLQVQSMNTNFLVTGSQDVQTMGVIMAIVAASLEIGVVVAITFFERKRELTVMSVRGMSSGQVASMLLVETLSVIGFALVLGLVVGFIAVIGGINSTAQTGQLMTERLVLPLNSVILIIGMVALVVMAAVTPAVVAARRAPANARRKGGW